MAAELTQGHFNEISTALTPVGGGRFEIYLNGEKLYDRKDPNPAFIAKDGDLYPFLKFLQDTRKKVESALESAKSGVGAGAHT